MSWNCSRSCRNPVVDELARLLAIVSRFICCALIPLAAVYNALIIFSLVWTRFVALHPWQVLGCKLVELGMEKRQRLLHHLGLALDDDQVHGSLDRILIGG